MLRNSLSAVDAYHGQWQFDFARKKLSHCPGFAAVIGWEQDSCMDLRDYMELMPAEYGNQLINMVRHARSGGRDFNLQVPLNTRLGKKWIRISGVMNFYHQAQADQVFGVIEDVTQLVQEEKLFLSIFNHEVRTPLTVIRLYTQMLDAHCKNGLPKFGQHALQHITLQTDRILALMDEFANTSFDQQRKKILNRTVFDLSELVKITLADLKMTAPTACFQFEPDAVYEVCADKLQIMQVLINYLTNALKFSPPNVFVRISFRNLNGYLEVGVHDQGPGFKQGHEAKLFEKFYRVDDRATRQQNSKGLGLYLVKQIIDQHGGSVYATTAENSGASFYFTIPMQDVRLA